MQQACTCAHCGTDNKSNGDASPAMTSILKQQRQQQLIACAYGKEEAAYAASYLARRLCHHFLLWPLCRRCRGHGRQLGHQLFCCTRPLLGWDGGRRGQLRHLSSCHVTLQFLQLRLGRCLILPRPALPCAWHTSAWQRQRARQAGAGAGVALCLKQDRSRSLFTFFVSKEPTGSRTVREGTPPRLDAVNLTDTTL